MKSLVAEPVFAGWVPEKPNRPITLHNWLPIYAWNELCEDRVDEFKLACLVCGQANRVPDAAPELHLLAKSPTGSALRFKRDRMTFQDE